MPSQVELEDHTEHHVNCPPTGLNEYVHEEHRQNKIAHVCDIRFFTEYDFYQ
jgi:hypothetical protein